MATLFLEHIFEIGSDSPSSVTITVPNKSAKLARGDDANPQLVGLMVGDPTFTAQNRWGTVIEDVSNLQDLTSLVGGESMFSWINASTMCWKGTAPLGIGIEFYLINYKKDLGLERNLRSFVKLASLYGDPDATAGQNYKVLVHAGYAADVLSGNKKYFTSAKDLGGLQNLSGDLKEVGGIFSSQYAQGAVELKFGHKMKIRNLLLTKINVTESTVEVADQNGGNRKPLYYRVNAQFTGARPLLTKDVDYMFGT